MKILAVSDVENGMIYSPQVVQRFGDVDLVIGCGDLPYYYLEYIISMLNKRLYYVKGNHAPRKVEETSGGPRTFPWGGFDLHRQVVRDESGLLLAGIEGSLRYNQGPYQYRQEEMWSMVLTMAPKLIFNKVRYGRYLDVFVTHAPAWGIHDKEDPPHQGIKAFRWLIQTFRPAYHLHGHIHVYAQFDATQTVYGSTTVINTYNYKQVEINFPGLKT